MADLNISLFSHIEQILTFRMNYVGEKPCDQNSILSYDITKTTKNYNFVP